MSFESIMLQFFNGSAGINIEDLTLSERNNLGEIADSYMFDNNIHIKDAHSFAHRESAQGYLTFPDFDRPLEKQWQIFIFEKCFFNALRHNSATKYKNTHPVYTYAEIVEAYEKGSTKYNIDEKDINTLFEE